MNPVIVVGAGISGVAAAQALTSAGLEVVALDRGHKVGGRMASRRTEGRMVDTGASYFTVSDDAFAEVVEDWARRGLAHEWTDTFMVADDGELSPKSGPARWAAPGGLRSLVEDLAVRLTVERRDVERVSPGPVVDGRPASAVVLAMPDPQARRLLDPAYDALIAALDDPYEPVLALTATWPDRCWPELDGALVADDGRRRGDGAPVLVAHSTGDFASEHLASPDEAADALVVALRDALGIQSEPSSTHVHRWTFAKPTGTRDEPFVLDPSLVGVCGDAWSDKPRVEAAYLSGRALGEAVAQRLAR